MRFRALGPLEVHDREGRSIEVGSAKLRTLLTLLLTEAGRVVATDRIVDELWGERPPATATGTLQSYVSNVRRLIGRDVLITRAPGYLVVADDESLDLLRFPRLVDAGTRSLGEGRLLEAEESLVAALALWRGTPLLDLADGPRTTAERARLEDLHVSAREQLALVHLRSGRPDRAAADLERLVAEQPLRERMWTALAQSLYAAGRQADALEACRKCARILRDELGLDPGPELREVEAALLRQDPALTAASPAAAVPVQRAPSGDAAPDQDDRPLVGRRGERARLRAALAEVTRGSGGVLVLEGEAGIGKTRLAEAATAMAGAQGWRAAWSRCADDAGAPALWPWTQLLQQLDSGALSAPALDDPDRSRFSLFQDLRARLQAAAAQAPLLVVLDDVQAADTTSLQLLALLAQHLDGIRVLLVLTVRTVGEELAEPVVESLATLAREPRVQRLQLQGLGEGDVRELLSSRLGMDQESLAREVHARTDGNPFFVVELAQLMRSEQQLGVGAPPVPPSVRDVLARRVARLPAPTVELLQLSAVVGRDVDLPLLQSAAELGAEQVISLLEPAVAAGVVTEDALHWQWRFSHALIQETLLAGLSRIDAARLHARVVRALESGPRSDVARLAHHCWAAVPVLGTEPARRYATLAAAQARHRLAHAEAAAHTRRALSLLGPADARERQDLLVVLGEDLLRSGHLQQAQDVVGEALALARELGDPARLAEAASVWGGVTAWNWRPYGVVDEELVALLEELADQAGEDDPALRARLLGTLGVELAYSRRREDGVAYALQAVDIARGTGDPVILGRALNNYGIVAWGSADRVERRLAAADESLALSGRGLPARTEFFALLHRGPLRLHLGDADGFRADLAAARRLAAGLTGPEVRPQVVYQEAGLAMLIGDWEVAEELAMQANHLYGQTSMWGARCCWALHQYTFRRREQRLTDVLDALVDAADALQVPILQSVAVLAAAEAGDRDEARRLRRRWPDTSPQDWTTDALLVVHARLALLLGGDVDAAYRSLLPYRDRQVVVGTATALWGPYDALLAELAAARGDRAAAEAHRAAVVRAADAVGAPWQADEVLATS